MQSCKLTCIYVHYWYAHKASYSSESEVPWIPRPIEARQILKSWRENEATRSKRLTNTQWNVPYMNLNDIDARSDIDDTKTISRNTLRGFISWNITKTAANWLAGQQNNGIVLSAQNENVPGRDIRFYSRERAFNLQPYSEVLCDDGNGGTAATTETLTSQAVTTLTTESIGTANETPSTEAAATQAPTIDSTTETLTSQAVATLTTEATTNETPTTEAAATQAPTKNPMGPLFQLRLFGIADCENWRTDDPFSKDSDIVRAIIDNVITRCGCAFTEEQITQRSFQCFPSSPQAVTYRARLLGTGEATVTDLIQDIEEWINDGASFPVQLQLLTVDSSCSVSVGSFTESECRANSSTGASDSVSTGIISTGAVIGVVVPIVFMLALLITAIIVATVVILHRKGKGEGSLDPLDEASAAEDIELSTKDQSPLYEQIHEEDDTSTKALLPRDYQRNTHTNVYVPIPALNLPQSSGGDGKYDTSRDELSGVAGRSAGQNENVTM